MKRLLCAVLAVAAAVPAATAGPVPRDAQDLVYLDDSGPILIRLRLQIDGRPLPDVWEEYIGQIFKYLDVNGDGVLSIAEAERAPMAQELLNSGAFFGGGGQPVSNMDTNRDGRVSREELADYYRRTGAAPFQFVYGGGNQVLHSYAAVAVDGRMIVNGGGNDLNEALFKLLDTNKDGKLSEAELKAGLALLRKRDENDDDMVSADEVKEQNNNAMQLAVAPPVAFAPNAMTSGGPFVTVAPGKRNPELARQIQNRYAPPGKGETKRLLNREVLGLDVATFARLDVDGDGILDFEELSRFGQRAPDLEFIVRLGKRGRQARIELVPARKGSPLAARTRQTKEGTVLDLGVTRLVFRSAQESNTRFVVAIAEQYKAQFKAADTDNNGYLDRNEAARSPFFNRVFKVMDRDGDGKLFEKEMNAYLERMKDLQEGAQKSCVSLSVQDQGRGIFDLIDSSRDGRLSVRELRNMVALVKQLDRDGDGCIARNEIPRSYQLNLHKGPPGGGGYGYAVFLGGAPVTPAPPVTTAGPMWFRKMDLNRDGDVSRREFLGTDAAFRKIDTDGDGLISVEEANRFDQRMRKEHGR